MENRTNEVEMTKPITTKTASRNHRWETRGGGDTDPTLSLRGLSLRGVFHGNVSCRRGKHLPSSGPITSRPEVGPARFGLATSRLSAGRSNQAKLRARGRGVDPWPT